METVEEKVKLLTWTAYEIADSELQMWALGTHDNFGLELNFHISGNKSGMER